MGSSKVGDDATKATKLQYKKIWVKLAARKPTNIQQQQPHLIIWKKQQQQTNHKATTAATMNDNNNNKKLRWLRCCCCCWCCCCCGCCCIHYWHTDSPQCGNCSCCTVSVAADLWPWTWNKNGKVKNNWFRKETASTGLAYLMQLLLSLLLLHFAFGVVTQWKAQLTFRSGEINCNIILSLLLLLSHTFLFNYELRKKAVSSSSSNYNNMAAFFLLLRTARPFMPQLLLLFLLLHSD